MAGGDRMVVVRLVAMVGQYRAAMAEAAAATKVLDGTVAATNRNITAANQRMIASQRKQASQFGQTMRAMRTGLLGLGLPLAIGAIAKSFLDFERQMAHVKAVSDTFGRHEAGMRMLRGAALDMGQAYGFSAVEVGKAQEALAKAGRGTAQVLGGDLSAALSLAAAGTISLDDSANIIAVTMSQFSDEVKNGGLTAVKVADLLSQAANATVSDVTGMATALAYVGPQAAGLGLSLEDTVTTLSLFNQAGLEADMAGTNLRGMLTGLMSPSKMAQRAMDDLGLSLWDAEGGFVGMYDMARQLNELLGSESGRTQQDIQNIVGRLSTNAQMPGFLTLIAKGEKGLRDMNRQILLQATAEDVAKDKLNSLTGDVEKFAATINTSAIKSLENLSGPLRNVTQDLTGVTQWFGEAGGAAQTAMLALGAYMLFGRQRMPRFVQGQQGSAMNRALAGDAQASAAQLRARADSMMRGFRALPFSQRQPGMLGAIANARAQARAAQDMANQYRGASGALGRFQGEWAAATTKMQRASVAARGLGSAIGTGSKGLMGALGGPWGLLITGALAGFTIFSSRAEAAEQRVQALRDATIQLGATFREQGGMTSTVNALFRTDELRGPARTLGQLGFGQAGIAAAAAGDRAQQGVMREAMNRQLGALRATYERNKLSMFESAGWLGRFSDDAEAVDKLKEQLDGLEKAWKDANEIADIAARQQQQDLGDTAKAMGISLDGVGESAKAMMLNVNQMGAPDAKLEDVLKAMAGNVDMVRASYLAASDAQSAFFGASAATADSFPTFKDKAGKEHRKAARVRFATGQFDFRTEAGRLQHQQASGVVTSALEMGKTVEAQGIKDLPDKYKAVDAAALAAASSVAEARKEFIRQYAPLVGGSKAAERLADSYGLVTSKFTDSIGASADIAVVADRISDVGARIDTIQRDGETRMVISADTTDALREVVGLQAAIEQDKVTGEVRYVLSNPAELEAIRERLGAPVSVPVAPQIRAGMYSSANAAEHAAESQRQQRQTVQVTPQLGGMPKVPNAPITLDPRLGPVPKVPNQSFGVFPNLIGGIPQFPDQTVNIRLRKIPDKIGEGRPGGLRWGGIRSFATGGAIQAHVQRGELIRYAEPETGGEAFIPRKGDPNRSRSILETAASWYGLGVHRMARGGLASFATGGVVQQSAPLGDFLSRYMGPADTWWTRRTDAMTEQRDALLSVKEAEKALRAARKDKKTTTLELRRAENELADARRNLALANTQLAKAKMPARDQFKAALDTGVRNTGRFISDLNFLASKGYGNLAMQLLQMGGPEAEAIAAEARKWPSSVAGRVDSQARNAALQQKTLENMPVMIAIRNAVGKRQSYGTLLGSGEFTGQEINAALALMQSELSKTAAGRAMLAAMRGDTKAALGAQIRGFATGGIASPGTLYRFAEPSTGGEAVIPRFGSNAMATLGRAAAWHGMSLVERDAMRHSVPARPAQVVITVRGEGVLSSMIETRVDGALVRAARAVTHGRAVTGA